MTDLPPADDAAPAPAAADEAAPLLVPNTETVGEDMPQAPSASRLLYLLSIASLGFSIDCVLLSVATVIIVYGGSRYSGYLPYSVVDAQGGIFTVVCTRVSS